MGERAEACAISDQPSPGVGPDGRRDAIDFWRGFVVTETLGHTPLVDAAVIGGGLAALYAVACLVPPAAVSFHPALAGSAEH